SLDLAVATTYGRGTWAIRTAPLIFSTTGDLLNNAPDLLNTDDTCVPLTSVDPAPCTLGSHTDNITRNDGSAGAPLDFTGLTQRGANVRLLEDTGGILTEIGRAPSDPITGDFQVAVGDGIAGGVTLQCGGHLIRAQAISASGTVGQVSDPILVSVLNQPPVEPAAPDLIAADDTGISNTDNITNIN